MSHLRQLDYLRVSPAGEDALATTTSCEALVHAAGATDSREDNRHSMLESFAAHRLMLFRIAYRILGCVSDAEDMVQEVWLRWQRQTEGRIQSAKAWLGSTMTRLCIDQLRSARRQRESSYGISVPELLASHVKPVAGDSDEKAHSLAVACTMILETLRPVERAVFLLHEVFGCDHVGVAGIVGKDVANCRQILRRAKMHLRAGTRDWTPTERAHCLARQIAVASRSGELTGMLALLDEGGAFGRATIDADGETSGQAQLHDQLSHAPAAAMDIFRAGREQVHTAPAETSSDTAMPERIAV